MVTTNLYYEINNVLTEHDNINGYNIKPVDRNSNIGVNICDEDNNIVARLDNYGLHDRQANFMNSVEDNENRQESYTLTTTGNTGDAFTVYPYGNVTPYETSAGSRIIWNQNDQVTDVPEEARPADPSAPIPHIDIKIEDNSFIRLDMNGGIYVNGKKVMTSTKILRAIEKLLIDRGFLDDYTVEEESTKDEDGPVRLKTLIENLRRKGVKECQKK